MRDIVLELLSSYGYAGMFALILIENLFPPIPSEVILTFGGIKDAVFVLVALQPCRLCQRVNRIGDNGK